jgi:putative metalloprotease
MDVMDDDQLMAIVGHEIGHVAHQDTKDAIKNAYINAAAREAVGAVGGTIGTLSDSMLGDIAETYLSARYSQKQENEADDYGFQFTVDNKRDPYSMMRSMQTLKELSGGGSPTSGLLQAFSSHPDTAAREARMKAKADAYTNK